MTMEVTEAAADVLKRAMQLGNVDPSVGGIRLRSARALGGGLGVQVELADGPLAGERVVETAGLRLFVDAGSVGTMRRPIVTLDPQHDTITVRDRDDAD
jgi:Fe-S cluster assembly iron-binding protein IscA